MKEKRFIRYGKFVLLLLVCGLAGGLASFTMSASGDHLSAVAKNALAFCRLNATPIICIVSAVLFAWFLLFYLKAKKGIAAGQDDDGDQRTDTAICFAQVITTVTQIFLITFMGIWMHFEAMKALILPSIVTVVLVLLFNGLEAITVGLQKKRTPGRKGDPLKLTFDRDWIESCDEAEKYVAYAAAFRSFLILKWVFALSLAVLLLLQLVFGTGFLPVATVGFLWLVHTVSYTFYSLKFYRSPLP